MAIGGNCQMQTIRVPGNACDCMFGKFQNLKELEIFFLKEFQDFIKSELNMNYISKNYNPINSSYFSFVII